MTCRTSSFCTVAWQLARFQLTRRIARSLGDSWASCTISRCNDFERKFDVISNVIVRNLNCGNLFEMLGFFTSSAESLSIRGQFHDTNRALIFVVDKWIEEMSRELELNSQRRSTVRIRLPTRAPDIPECSATLPRDVTSLPSARVPNYRCLILRWLTEIG